MKEIENKVKALTIRPNHIFRGQLLIVNQCRTCGYKS